MMLQKWYQWQKSFARRLTIMVVPHGTGKPRQITFSVPFIVFMLTGWTGLTAWATYMTSERLDYWRMKTNSHMMRIKVEFFAHELKEAREMLDDVKEADSQLRAMLNMGSRDAIIQSETSFRNTGGPSAQEEEDFNKMLAGRVGDMSIQDIARQVKRLREETKNRMVSFDEISNNIEKERRLYRATPNMWPVPGVVTSHFGGRSSPFTGETEFHAGMDLAAPAGTPVRATADGIIQIAGWAGGYGKVVVINHEFGYSTRYGHNRQLLVKRGDRVKRGQIIALVGSTGSATGPHCHYEVWQNGRYINPRRFMKREG